jgi:putative MFS transporter
MATLGLTEGSQITVFTLMIPLLHKEWDVSDNINELQTSLVFLGFIIGSLFSGKIADRYGRRIPFLYSTLFTVIFTLGQCLCV